MHLFRFPEVVAEPCAGLASNEHPNIHTHEWDYHCNRLVNNDCISCCSGRALCRPRTKPHPNRRDVRSCVRTDEPPNRMRSWHTFINITLIIFRLSFGCEAGTRHGHYFWKPKKVLLKALLCDFLNHLINRELRNDLFTTRNRHFRMPITVLSQRETSHLANLLETGCMQE